MRTLSIALLATLIAGCASAVRPASPTSPTPGAIAVPQVAHPAGETPQWWYTVGASRAAANGAMRGHAKNVILFLGDGMSLTTVDAARILDGQRRGQPGEENQLSWERFPNTALSKTYNTDAQTPDSAGTMSAIMTGVKTFMGAISVAPGPVDCAGSRAEAQQTWLELAARAGMSTGVISTARLTHATPGATYAHVPDREWENDTKLPADAVRDGCTDIARQFIESPYSSPTVALAGGRGEFLPKGDGDGLRGDGRNLVDAWKTAHPQGAYVTDTEQLDAAGAAPQLLGLFAASHMDYDHDRDTSPQGQPSLEQMTRAAIRALSRNPNGYVLMVEGARIDMANHEGNAFRALDDTLAMDRAVQAARGMTSPDDTLILVTADHAHTLTFVGYPVRGNPMLGLVRGRNSFEGKPGKFALDKDGKPYTTLSYANGPGYRRGARPDLREVDTQAPDYLQEALVPLGDESHSGEDVGIWADGPGSDAVRGTVEQNTIYHVIVQATPRLRAQLCVQDDCNADGVPVRAPGAGTTPATH